MTFTARVSLALLAIALNGCSGDDTQAVAAAQNKTMQVTNSVTQDASPIGNNDSRALLVDISTADGSNLASPSGKPSNGETEAQPLIAGGDKVSSNDPFLSMMARLTISFPDGTKVLCSGSVISRFWVLTAAHCLTKETKAGALTSNNADIEIGITGVYATSPTRKFKATEIIAHDKFNRKTGDYDVALLKLDRPINFTITTPGVIDFGYERYGYMGEAYGYGTTLFPGKSITTQRDNDELRSMMVTFVDENKCSSDKYFMGCATSTDETTGFGDSGGPLVMQTGLFARINSIVASGGNRKINGKNVYHMNFTRLNRYIAWINAKTKAPCLTCVAHHITEAQQSRSIVVPSQFGVNDGEFIMTQDDTFNSFAKLIYSEPGNYPDNDVSHSIEVQRQEASGVWKTAYTFKIDMQDNPLLNTSFGFTHLDDSLGKYRLMAKVPSRKNSEKSFTLRVYANAPDSSNSYRPARCSINSPSNDNNERVCAIEPIKYETNKSDGALFWKALVRGSVISSF